jgi:cellulose synthase/poly-beta-1,6-N-acetylglucosamine synthase-like glycosyltransferase
MSHNVAFLFDDVDRRPSGGSVHPTETRPFFPPLRLRPKMTPLRFLLKTAELLVDWRWWCGLQSKIIERDLPPVALVTVLVPAHNEEDRIAETIDSLLTQPNLHSVVVINDGSKDATGEIADRYARAYPDIIQVIHREKPSGHKAGALNTALRSGLPMAECVAVIDGDTILHEGAFARMLVHFFDPKIGGVGARVVSGTLLEEVSFAYRAKDGENTIGHWLAKPAQCHVGALLVSAGCCTILRKEVFDLIGYFKEGTSAEDMELSWRVSTICDLAYEPSAICYSAEPPTVGVYVRQRVRWTTGFLECYKMHVMEGRMRTQNFRLWLIANHMFMMGLVGIPLLIVLMVTGNHAALSTLLQWLGIEPDETKIWMLSIASLLVLTILAITVTLFLGARSVAKQEDKRLDVRRVLKNIFPTFIGSFIVQGVFLYCCWRVFFTTPQATSWGSGNKRGE